MAKGDDVADNEDLVRRIHWTHTTETGDLKSLAFRDRELSVHRTLIWSAEQLRNKYPLYGQALILTSAARHLGQILEDQLPDDPSHALICCRQSPVLGLDKFAKALRHIARDRWDPEEYLPIRKQARRADGYD